ncbi:D-inositol 3-phosphate glycosyltransferase [Peptococcaceae bacterium CEB3]|nr:D-inositol 3-phosphate glycosyltransferase [Peptococcaceae bacterium CEB3]
MNGKLKIAIATAQVPFVRGGAEIHAEMLKDNLIKRGYEAEIVTIPFKWYPEQALADSIFIARMVDLAEANGEKIDLMIGMKFPAYLIEHERKVLWLLHQHRTAYELWNTEFGDLHHMQHGDDVRRLIIGCDNKFIPRSRRVYTNSLTVAKRLLKYNGIKAQALYHPPILYEQLRSGEYGDYIFYPSRINKLKRQYLLVRALKYCKSPAHVVIAGSGENDSVEELLRIAEQDGLSSRLTLLGRVSDEELIRWYADALGVYFGPYEEDYGYITLEAFFSGKPVITHVDSGGPLEFVNENNGYITEPNPEAIAEAIDNLYFDKRMARQKGQNGLRLMRDLNINWDHVIESLVSV